jgi:uncharacterized membrane protein
MGLDDIIGGIRQAAGRNPATQRLLEEAEGYLQAQGKRVVSSLAGGMKSGGGAGLRRGLQEMAQSGSPGKALLSGGVEAIKSSLGKKGGGGKPSLFIEDIDIGVPVSTAYNQWTQYQEFASFMKGIENVEAQDPQKSTWRGKIGPSRRQWEAHVVEQIPDRRIVWESKGEKGSTKGVVTFHPLADDLTKLLLVMEYYPQGPVEKVGNWMRLQGRRVHLDLMAFRRHITLQGEESGAWRGVIEEGEVRDEGGAEEDDRDGEQPRQEDETRDEDGAQHDRDDEQPRQEDGGESGGGRSSRRQNGAPRRQRELEGARN